MIRRELIESMDLSNEFYSEKRNRSNNSDDRYKDCSILEDKETEITFLSTREPINIPVRSTDIYHRVNSHEVGRLDIIANMYYRNPLLWWVIAQANDIYDPITLIAPGTLLRVPNLETLYGNHGILL